MEQAKAWKDACLQANGGVAQEAARLQKELKQKERENRKLQEELDIKERANIALDIQPMASKI